ncbi:DUF3261 domain-containing protein [Shewanella sp. AS16]|uniref:DUF3261 domain-containing protein n=1 Tax=Shewanella sp. AS16 TaxID=2907625 RepID=UPI001F36CAF0|nr:DUF3261 domain-containing protein [Shewanella sp. AS16]MCE9687945.1 DUF3261 domain-containing protein [Shewanella sp. AS16]
MMPAQPRKTLLCLLALLPALLLSGCSQLLLRQTCVGLSHDIHYCLAPIELQPPAPKHRQAPETKAAPGSGGEQQVSQLPLPFSATYKVAIAIKDASHELLSQIELDEARMTVVGLAPLGQALFTLEYDGTTLSSRQSLLLGEQFKAEYLLAMMQLIYWPELSLAPRLEGGVLVAAPCGADWCRNLYPGPLTAANATPVLSIRYDRRDPWLAQVQLQMPETGFSLNIKPL